MKSIYIAFIFMVSFSLAACKKTPDDQQLYHDQIITFGTVVDISFYGIDRQEARTLTQVLTTQFDYMNEAWHAWHPGVLAEVNEQLATGEPFIADEGIVDLIVQAKTLYQNTHGYYNPTIGQLIELWQFNQFSERRPVRPPLNNAIVEIVDQHPSMDDIRVEGRELQSSNPTVLLDFGGFAKGYAIDRVIEYLKSQGVENAMINAGGDLRAIGRAQHRRPWMIAIQNPNTTLPFAVLPIQGDESVFTSGDYARYFTYRDKHYHHIIDPRTGYPTRHPIRSATVLHDNGAEADAAATALMVTGLEDWHAVAEGMGIAHILLIDDENNVYMTPDMQKRITLLYSPAPNIIILE